MHSHAKKTSIKVGQQVDPICVWLSKDGKEETLYDKHFRVSISLSLYIAALSMVLGTTGLEKPIEAMRWIVSL